MAEDGGLRRGAQAVGQGLTRVSLPRLLRPEGPVAGRRGGWAHVVQRQKRRKWGGDGV